MMAILAGKKTKMKLKTTSGFTIIELLITVSLLAVVMSFAIPSFTFSMANSRVKTAASDFHADMMLARSEAITRRVNVSASDNTDGWLIRVFTDPTDATVFTDIRDINDLSSDIGQICNINNDAAGEACPTSGVIFDRNGRPSIPTYEMRFWSSSRNDVAMRCVKLSLSGRPSVLMDTDGVTADGCD
jgi:prepilin-type N-terminal cleavage/methylation domain-containing protein